MNVGSDCARHEPPLLIERPADGTSIPSIIKSTVRHRIVIGKSGGKIVEHYWDTLLVRLIDNGAGCVSSRVRALRGTDPLVGTDPPLVGERT